MIIDALRGDENLWHEFGIQGRVAFYDRANPAETSLENSLEQMHLQDARSNTGCERAKGRGRGAAKSRNAYRSGRRRNRRADQFCVHVLANERQKPIYAVEFKAPHKVTITELVAGLHEMDLARDVLDQDGNTF